MTVKLNGIDEAAVTAFVDDAVIVIAHNSGFDRKYAERYWPVFETKAWGYVEATRLSLERRQRWSLRARNLIWSPGANEIRVARPEGVAVSNETSWPLTRSFALRRSRSAREIAATAALDLATITTEAFG